MAGDLSGSAPQKAQPGQQTDRPKKGKSTNKRQTTDTHTDKLTSRETDMESGGQTDRQVPPAVQVLG